MLPTSDAVYDAHGCGTLHYVLSEEGDVFMRRKGACFTRLDGDQLSPGLIVEICRVT
jgi:hypothetical protein